MNIAFRRVASVASAGFYALLSLKRIHKRGFVHPITAAGVICVHAFRPRLWRRAFGQRLVDVDVEQAAPR